MGFVSDGRPGRVPVRLSEVRLGVVRHDESVSAGAVIKDCLAFVMVSLEAIINVLSSVSIALSAIHSLDSFFSSLNRRACASSVAVSSFRYRPTSGFGMAVGSRFSSWPESSEGILAVSTSVD